MNSKEAFEKIVESCNIYHHTIVKDTNIELICCYPIDNIRRDLEVLEIIKKKEVVIGLLKGILHSDLHTHTASYYNSHFVANYRHLTQEEFDLLKEWLSNE